MKIGITCYPTYGGSGVVATELGKKLAQMGHEIHFISYALPYRLAHFQANLYFHEVEVVKYALFEYPSYDLPLATRMVDVVEHYNLDILHVHYAIPHATSAFLAREMIDTRRLKFVTTLHGTDITLIGADPSYKKIVRFSIEKSDGVTAVSQFLKNETCDIFDIGNDVRVIPNFIPDDFLHPLPASEMRRCCKLSDSLILTHVSNFRPLKRVLDLIPLMEKLVKRFNVKLLMVGDGPERSVMERMTYQQNLDQQILFLGKQDNVADILAMSDVFLLPSENESFGLAALEAMACGVPCVTSNAGGLPEVNIHGATGYVCPVGDIDTLTESTAKLLGDRELRRTLGENARKIAFENFPAEKIVTQYLDYYTEVLNR
jgi:N-acetyl-alpha-D-glucosaminyl L-malate synthase BshA